MLSRASRRSLVLFLLIVGAAGGYAGYDTLERHARVFADERAALARLDAMLASVNELAVTQRGYFEPVRGGTAASGPQFQRVRQLTDELKVHLEALRSQLTSPETLEQLTTLSSALDDFSTTDTRVRTNLANDTYFSAADLVFSASATELRSVTGALITLKGLATSAAAAQYDSLQKRAALIAGAVGLVWTVGLLVLAPLGSREDAQTSSVAQEPQATSAAGDGPPAEPLAEAPAAASTEVHHQTGPVADLEAAARVCVAMARAASAADLREILAEAASAVHASGMVVWLGAGEELFPVLGHGYDSRMLARIGPLARHDANATTVAWRKAETQVVPGDQGRAGAIVVPLISTQGCIGVLSAEVPSGQERDAGTQAVTTLFAAQLSTIVAAWPEPSAAADESPAAQSGSIAITL